MDSQEKASLGAKICKWWTHIDDKHCIEKLCEDNYTEYALIKKFYSKEFIEMNKCKNLITGEIILRFSCPPCLYDNNEYDSMFHEYLASYVVCINGHDFCCNDLEPLRSYSYDELKVKLDLRAVE